MAGHTTRLNLYKPGGGLSGLILPDEVADIDKINGNMDLIDAAMGSAVVTSVTRPGGPYTGQIIRETDTGRTMIWTGAAWLQVTPPEQGSSLVKPTSSVNGTISALGTVTFTAVALISVNGCFVAGFDWYEIYYDFTTSAAALANMVLRVAGVDAVAAQYDSQRATAIAAAAAAAQTLAATSWPIGPQAIVAGENAGKITLYNPFKAQATEGLQTSLFTANPMTATGGIVQQGLQHRLATAYDGFTITPASGTISGTLRVLGVNNG